MKRNLDPVIFLGPLEVVQERISFQDKVNYNRFLRRIETDPNYLELVYTTFLLNLHEADFFQENLGPCGVCQPGLFVKSFDDFGFVESFRVNDKKGPLCRPKKLNPHEKSSFAVYLKSVPQGQMIRHINLSILEAEKVRETILRRGERYLSVGPYPVIKRTADPGFVSGLQDNIAHAILYPSGLELSRN